MMSRKIKILLLFYGLISLALFFYSFTQVDLSFAHVLQGIHGEIQRKITYFGYFNRPASTAIFTAIIFSLTLFYIISILFAKRGILSFKNLSIILGVTAIILFFSYPAFSYDIYNYMFDAKTVLVYGKNPYAVKPLDFPSDPWLVFMHWTHRPSVYPPIWIGMTLLPYLLGLKKFILIILNFKLLMSLAFLGTAYLIHKIALEIKMKNPILPVVLFALNPAMLIENLVSAHNDIVMMFFAVLGVYLLLKGKLGLSFISIITATLIKYTAVILVPLAVYEKIRIRLGKPVNGKRIIQLSTIFMLISFVAVVSRIEIQPWYLVWILPFLALWDNDFFIPLIVGATVGLLLRYAPFIFFGHWNDPVPQIELQLTLLAFICIIPFELYLLYKRRKHAT